MGPGLEASRGPDWSKDQLTTRKAKRDKAARIDRLIGPESTDADSSFGEIIGLIGLNCIVPG